MNLLVNADARSIPIADKSVHCIVTSPPYYGLRDYGVPGQLGLEPTPRDFVDTMVQVGRELWRVLRDDGTWWLNLGDTYAGGGRGGNGDTITGRAKNASQVSHVVPSDYKPKDLIGIPWMVAFALRAEGWYLRSDIIWHKPNPMPESVRDRPTKSHEYIFLLTKSARYYYDQEATLKPGSPNTHLRVSQDVASQIGSLRANGGTKTNGPMKAVIRTPKQQPAGSRIKNNQSWDASTALPVIKRNMRSVWDIDEEVYSQYLQLKTLLEIYQKDVWKITTKSYSGAHYATFPPDLIEPCILAGTSEHGVCPRCGAPWERIIEKRPTNKKQKTASGWQTGPGSHPSIHPDGREKEYVYNPVMKSMTIGWQPTCECGIEETVPATVLDPFVGSGTTCMVARKHGRHAIGLDLSFEYLNTNARERLVYGGFVPVVDGIRQLTIEAGL